jgi:hypothetical protein
VLAVDDLLGAIGQAEASAALVELELAGLVSQVDGVYRCRPDRSVLAR